MYLHSGVAGLSSVVARFSTTRRSRMKDCGLVKNQVRTSASLVRKISSDVGRGRYASCSRICAPIPVAPIRYRGATRTQGSRRRSISLMDSIDASRSSPHCNICNEPRHVSSLQLWGAVVSGRSTEGQCQLMRHARG